MAPDSAQLGDFGLEEIELYAAQEKDKATKARFEKAASVIVPLLRKHPVWRWQQAVEYLRSRGELPDLAAVDNETIGTLANMISGIGDAPDAEDRYAALVKDYGFSCFGKALELALSTEDKERAVEVQAAIFKAATGAMLKEARSLRPARYQASENASAAN
jgi:hypothetical protein